MAYTKIRKNASKKIAGLIAEATYITLETQTMGLDDCFSSSGETEVDAAFVAEFMERNYGDLVVRLSTDENGEKKYMTISDGPYYFSDEITVHFTAKPVEAIEVMEVEDAPAKPRMTLAAVQAFIAEGFISPLNHGVKEASEQGDAEKQIKSVFVVWSESGEFNAALGCNSAFNINKSISIEEYERLAWATLKSTDSGTYNKTRVIITTESGDEYTYRHDISKSSPSLRQAWAGLVERSRAA